jgi:hypothetical protein
MKSIRRQDYVTEVSEVEMEVKMEVNSLTL